ncbi:uncharacterized protein DUF4383 [Thermosporothrix hazakensis]|jgi:hypothetical protein|uniref:Uncharacterized protein DUF4383 n=2 Tax=Thermosporothrix TaxID=768650 RepID=A0A326U881_THEHA|nr:DUF4383 domain-containing protein [Thermosporothrix hazakensis]PZW29499.1 uncharacterized protein DUF4383 [Thermosporothrix hazakensis]BBH85785.1 hypothetical protein KTC_05360 [Thermosporothrix sp. COM3]GCE45786.1 hypothetical protein KTH_06550 [Thermosporothrix hazakensis]
MPWTASRYYTLIVTIVFLIVGVLGIGNTSTMQPANFLGLDLDIVHNFIHLATGFLALSCVIMGWDRRFNQIFGVVYVVLALLGLLYPFLYFDHRLLGIMHANIGDHLFHFVAGAIALYFGFAYRREPVPAA